MHTHPEIGRLLANSRIKEAQARLMAVPAIRAAALERPQRTVAERAVSHTFVPEAATAGIARRWLARQSSPRTGESGTNG